MRIPPVRPAHPGFATFVAASAPTDEALQSLLHKIIARLTNLPTRRGVLGEEEGVAYLTDGDADLDDVRTLRPLQAADGKQTAEHRKTTLCSFRT